MKKYAPYLLISLLALAGCGPSSTQVKDAPPPQAGVEEKVPERVGVKSVETKPAKPVVLWKPEKKKEREAQPPEVTAKVETPPPAPMPVVKAAPVAKVEPVPVPAPIVKVEPVPVPSPPKVEVPPPPPAPKVELPPPPPPPVTKVEVPPPAPPVPVVPAKSPREYLMEARSEHMAGRNRQALPAVVKAREGFPLDLEPALLEARIRYELDDREEGLKLLEGFITRGEGGAEVLDTYVAWTMGAGLAQRAITHLESLKSSTPVPNPEIVGPLGWLHYKTNNAKAALDNFDLLEGTPAYGKWAVFAARLRLQNSDTARARASAERADHGAAQARAILAEVQAVEGHATEAEGALKTSLPGDAGSYEATNGLGLLRLNQGDAKGASTYFRAAAEKEATRPEAHNNLGVALRAQGDETGAEAAFAKALAVSPDYPPALKNLGILKEKFQGDYPEAVKFYARYLEKVPGDKEVERYLKAATRSAEESKAAQETRPVEEVK